MRNYTRVKMHEPDYRFFCIMLALLVIGLIMLSSASSVVGYQKFQDSQYYIKHQLLLGVLIGSLGFFFSSRIDYHVWESYAFPLLVVTITALFFVLIPGIGYGSGGANRWISVGGFFFQPSEMAKLVFLLYLAAWLSKKGERLHNLAYGLFPFLALIGVITFLMMLQPDFGTMSVIAFVSLMMYFMAGASFRNLALMVIGGIAVFALLIKIAPYRAARFTVFLQPDLDPQGIGYHVNQALLAIGSGGILGVGLGHSRQKYNYLPEVIGDSIFAIIAEELGFILSVGIIVLFLYFMVRGLRIAKYAPDTFGTLVAGGIIVWILIQTIINIGSMVSIFPLTGVPLPFMSYGSSSLVIILIAMGILFNISKQTRSS